MVEETKDISKLGVQELKGSLKSFTHKLNQNLKKKIENAFQSKINFGAKNNNKQPYNNDKK